MDYIKVHFGDELDFIEPNKDKTLGGILQAINPYFVLSECVWEPCLDIFETQESLYILAEVSGVSKENLDLEINNKTVKISGKRSEPFLGKNGNYKLAEIQYGSFERILSLPTLIDTGNVSASYSNGLLNIKLAKLLTEKTKKIHIQDGELNGDQDGDKDG